MTKTTRFRAVLTGALLLAGTLLGYAHPAAADDPVAWSGAAKTTIPGPITATVSGEGAGIVSGLSEHVDFQCTSTPLGFYIVGTTWVRCWLLGADGSIYAAPQVSAAGAPEVTTSASVDVPAQAYQLCMAGGNTGAPANGVNGSAASGCFPLLP
jgi:hypothetical protein